MPIFVKCVRTVYINVKRGVQDIENKAWYLHNKESRFVSKLISKGQNSQFNSRLKVTIISFVALKTCVTCKWCRTHSLIPNRFKFKTCCKKSIEIFFCGNLATIVREPTLSWVAWKRRYRYDIMWYHVRNIEVISVLNFLSKF